MQGTDRTQATPWLRFDRHELGGAFGDIGTDLPLLIALVASSDLNAASVCWLFGLMQIATGLAYGIPMPVQPLKAMATIMLTGSLAPATFFVAILISLLVGGWLL